MSDQPAPPPPTLDPKHDAETLALLDKLDTGPVKDLEANKKALREHLAQRIAGDLRPRILAAEKLGKDAGSQISALQERLKTEESENDALAAEVKKTVDALERELAGLKEKVG